MADVSRMVRRAFDERAKTLGVTRTQWQVMTVLKRHEGINQGRLAEHLDVEPITLCRMADRLQEAGMVERRRDPTDRRVWRLYLTDKAKQLSEELKPLGQEVLSEAMEGVSAQEREMMSQSLQQMRLNLVKNTPAKGLDPND
ncbi:MarR family transcriptional regulator [Aestuariicella hydrocarbonica]|uniref:MarR family transcriptional regulator n=1 Tax=Pseudomaricurvus hydrocarbonicus TaxID=1470433 RepID=A0A9E5JV35_9GAMM|nr:MarR family transcriptional regulator [Aestuariicella hydrocarbonica]NHO65440.1 MarR family transcriptional regulator [Aestuariicella hydrocarbonica]